jgi:heterodisulfide reductase subunit B
MKYAYYPGCSLHSTAREYDISARAVCQALGIELEEIPGWTCCGASAGHMTSRLLSAALPVKDLARARGMGLDTAVCCAACYSRLKIANATMTSGKDIVADVDDIVGAPYRGESKVKHLLEIVANEYGLDELQERVTKDLSGLKVAAYYGCLLVRPPEVMGFDDPENPTLMDNLITALGAQAVDWPYKVECCGGSLGLTRTDVLLKLCRDIFQMASDAGADCILVACPLCHSNLDMREAQVNKRYKAKFDLPILYFTQLIGLALGMEAKELALNKHVVSTRNLLRAKALA